MTRRIRFALGCVLTLAAGCLTVNVYFPAPEIRPDGTIRRRILR